jgi:hypothetical protein
VAEYIETARLASRALTAKGVEMTERNDDYRLALGLFEKAGGPSSGYGMGRWLEGGFDAPGRTVRLWLADGFPTPARRALELLELVPLNRWPKCWRLDRQTQSPASVSSRR